MGGFLFIAKIDAIKSLIYIDDTTIFHGWRKHADIKIKVKVQEYLEAASKIKAM